MQSQHPAELVSPGGIVVALLEEDRGHKWLGRTRSKHTDGSHGLALDHHLQAAFRVVYAKKKILSEKGVSIAQGSARFDVMVTPLVFFACGHREIYKQDPRNLDIKLCELVRTIVGGLGGLDWSAPWHGIFHE